MSKPNTSIAALWLLACMALTRMRLPTSDAFQPSTSRGVRHAPTTRLLVDGQGMSAGSTRHLLGDVLRSLQPKYLSQVKDAVRSNLNGPQTVNATAFVDAASDLVLEWEEVERRLPTQRRAKVNGKSSQSNQSDNADEPTVIFYRDSAAWCPYCQKVWIALEELQIPYQVIKIDMRCYGVGKPTDFLRLQPSGNLPCAVINGQVVQDSDDIIDALSDGALRPPEHADRIRDLCDNGRESLERRMYARWMWWLTGVRRPQEYRDLMIEHFAELEEALQHADPFMLGQSISIADIRFLPFVERQIASLVYFKGYNPREDFPNLNRWLSAMEARASYRQTKSDWYTHSQALPPQLAADCVAEDGCEESQSRIDYLSTARPHDATNSTLWDWNEPGWGSHTAKDDRHEVVRKLVQNHVAVAKFCARGAGTMGSKVVSAKLSDPTAKPNPDVQSAVDVVLRLIAMALLSGEDGKIEHVSAVASKTMSASSIAALIDCLDYLRARIGVPRDMSHGAAQEFRRALLKVSVQLSSSCAAAAAVNAVETETEMKEGMVGTK